MPKYKILYLSILLIIIVGFISYKIYEKFQIIECSTVKNCKTCAQSFGCLWCKTSKKCISDLSKNSVCFRESTVSDPFGCDIDSVEVAESNLNSPLFGGKCSNNKDCLTCLRSPDCFWCNDSQKCAVSVELYAQCKDDATIYNSPRRTCTAIITGKSYTVFSQGKNGFSVFKSDFPNGSFLIIIWHQETLNKMFFGIL